MSQFAALARKVKTAMITEMAFDFATMTRVLTEGSKPRIIAQLGTVFAKPDSIPDQAAYDQLHSKFCDWFTTNVQTAEKKWENGRMKLAAPCSYGHAAKVLDIAAKVYVYYCDQPTAETAQLLVPMLHGALDNQIIEHLKDRFPDAGIKATSILDTDRGEYERLQELVGKAIQEDFNLEIYRVQFDDIMFRRLNRTAAAAT